jgi:hypothetical protein
MPWLVKALLLALRTKRGRRLLVAGGMGAVELVRKRRRKHAWQN